MPANDDFEAPIARVTQAPIDQVLDATIDLRSMIGVLLRHWRLIVAVPTLAAVATYGALRLVHPQYKSTVEILVVDPKRQVDGGINRPLTPFDVDSAAMSSEIAVIESKSLALRVAKELGLDKDEEFQRPGRLRVWGEKLGLARLPWFADLLQTTRDANDENAALDRAAKELRQRLHVERLQYSYVLAISITSENPVKAERLARTIADVYLTEQAETRYDATHRAERWLTGRLDELRSRVLGSEEAMLKLKAQGGLSDVGVGSNISQQQTSDINTQLMEARADVAEKRARFEQARHLVDRGGDIQEIPEVMASAVITQLRIQQSEVSRREADLRSQFGERFPEVIAIRSQQEDIKKAISAEVGRILGNMKNAYDIATRREQSLEASLQRVTASRADSEADAKLRELQPVADADRKAYESFLSQLNEISQRSTLQDNGARIITPATLPKEPSYPRRVLIYLLVGVIATGVGVVLAILAEYLAAGFKTGSQVEQMFGYRVIGMIPLVPPKRRFRRAAARDIILHGLVEAPLSQLGEAVRTTRVRLGLSSPDGTPKVILVTSSIPGEGKSTTSMLIGVSSAMSGMKTVLVDCDLRHTSLSHAFGANDKGLAEVLTGTANVATVTIKDETTGTHVIPAGFAVNDPTTLLSSRRMHDLFAHLRKQYDCVVVDASPLLPVVDALALAAMVDKILMVIEWNRTPQTGVAEAFKVLMPEAHRLAGVVLSKVDFKRLRKHGYGYGSGYNYGSYYRRFDNYYTSPASSRLRGADAAPPLSAMGLRGARDAQSGSSADPARR
jgi:polysaccharide biosynthesis transport protein